MRYVTVSEDVSLGEAQKLPNWWHNQITPKQIPLVFETVRQWYGYDLAQMIALEMRKYDKPITAGQLYNRLLRSNVMRSHAFVIVKALAEPGAFRVFSFSGLGEGARDYSVRLKVVSGATRKAIPSAEILRYAPKQGKWISVGKTNNKGVLVLKGKIPTEIKTGIGLKIRARHPLFRAQQINVRIPREGGKTQALMQMTPASVAKDAREEIQKAKERARIAEEKALVAAQTADAATAAKAAAEAELARKHVDVITQTLMPEAMLPDVLPMAPEQELPAIDVSAGLPTFDPVTGEAVYPTALVDIDEAPVPAPIIPGPVAPVEPEEDDGIGIGTILLIAGGLYAGWHFFLKDFLKKKKGKK